MITRDPTLVKRGDEKTDKKVKLKANFYKLLSERKISPFLYRVDFEPETEICGLRKYLIGQHKEQLGGNQYDGE